MPAPSTLLLYTVLMLLLTIFTYVQARQKESNFKYKTALGYLYITEISFMFFLFLLLFSSPLSPFTYKETSNLKVFLDFFTVYQITVFIFSRTIKSVSDQPYKFYILMLKRVDIMFAKKQWNALQEYSKELKEKFPVDHFNKAIYTRKNHLHAEIELFLTRLELIELKNEVLKGMTPEGLMAYQNEQLEENIDIWSLEDTITVLREHIELEVAQTELLLEEEEVHWSGSIALILVPILERKISESRNRIVQRTTTYINVVVNFLTTYHFYIINLMLIIITLILTIH